MKFKPVNVNTDFTDAVCQFTLVNYLMRVGVYMEIPIISSLYLILDSSFDGKIICDILTIRETAAIALACFIIIH